MPPPAPALALAIAALALAPAWGAPAPAAEGIAPPGLLLLRGDLHAHTCYSDGEATPADAFAAVKAWGKLDFFAVTEHSELLLMPFCAHEACVVQPLDCYAAPAPPATEWSDVLAQADAATDASFVGLRGFEWSSFVEGHVNVLGSAEFTDILRTPVAPMAPLYAWLALPPPLGGADGVAGFNHPGVRDDLMFDDFAHSGLGEPSMQLLEVYNRGDVLVDAYVRALDRGWHVGAIGVTDGHDSRGWLAPHRGRTLVLAEERTRGAILAGLDAMRTAGTDDLDLEVVFGAGEHLMGATIDAGGADVEAFVRVRDPTPGGGLRRVEVRTAGGAVHAALDAGGAAAVDWRPVLRKDPGAAESWFFVHVEGVGGLTAITAPLWLR